MWHVSGVYNVRRMTVSWVTIVPAGARGRAHPAATPDTALTACSMSNRSRQVLALGEVLRIASPLVSISLSRNSYIRSSARSR